MAVPEADCAHLLGNPLAPVVDGRVRILCCHRSRLRHETTPNSLSGVAECIAASAPRIEVDVRFSSDDVPVVFHDETLDIDTDGAGAVTECDSRRLRRLRIRGTDEGIPLLSEVLDLLRGIPTRLQVDLKPLRPLTPPQVTALKRSLEPQAEQVLLGSPAYWSLRAFEGTAIPLSFDPTLMFGKFPTMPDRSGVHPHHLGPEGFLDDNPLARVHGRDLHAYLETRLEDACRALTGVRELMLNIETVLTTARLGFAIGDFLATRGVELAAWTLSDLGEAQTSDMMAKLFGAGTTTLITDHPFALSAYLRSPVPH